MSNFREKVLEVIKGIPLGYVMSYGQVALFAECPRCARQVGQILKSLDRDPAELEVVPWWRVVNNEGRLSIIGNDNATRILQKKLLELEGIEFKDDITFDIEKYRY